jgi:hypothetical protein
MRDDHGIMKEPTTDPLQDRGGSLSASAKDRGTLQGRSLARRSGSRARRAPFIGRDIPVEFGEEAEVVSTKPASSHASIDVEGMNASNRDASPARGSALGGPGPRRLDPLGGHGCDLVSHSRQPYSGRQTNHPRGRSVRVLRRRRGASCTRDAGTFDGRLNRSVLSAYGVTIGVTRQDLEPSRGWPTHPTSVSTSISRVGRGPDPTNSGSEGTRDDLPSRAVAADQSPVTR